MNTKGAIFSAYIYVLLVFFLLSLSGLLFVLNNTRMLSNKIKEETGNVINSKSTDFSIDLLGPSNVCLNFGEEYSELGFSAEDKAGNELPVIIDSNLDIWKSGTYIINYISKYNNEEKAVTRTVTVLQNDFLYTGDSQEFIAGCDGYFKVELWGAQGGSYSATLEGGTGAYTSGYISLKNDEMLYLYIGEEGKSVISGTTYYSLASYNGGGASGAYDGVYSQAGGGSTDIRLLSGDWDDDNGLKSRIMVAGGGGGSTSGQYTIEGDGGELIGATGAASGGNHVDTTATGGTQISGGVDSVSSTKNGLWGMALQSNVSGWGGGGGGGYYGGAMGNGTGGGGGSSFISGYAGVNAITNDSTLTHSDNTIQFSNKCFIDGYMNSGVNSGNGKAKITYIGSTHEKLNSTLNNVRYIKDCVNGSTSNTYDHWVELQAIKDGVNIAYQKPVEGTTGYLDSHLPYSAATDGDITSANYTVSDAFGLQCITVDLGITYDLDEIAVWHYYTDGRSYYDHDLSVSDDNSSWASIISNNGIQETPGGQHFNAYNVNPFAYSSNDNLLVQYDGINNTGYGHSDSITDWKDISGNSNDGELTAFAYTSSSGWDSNGLVFDGVDDGIYLDDKLSDLFKTDNTVELVIKFNETGRDVLFGNYNTANGNNFEKYSANEARAWINYGTYNAFSTSTLPVGNKMTLAFLFDKTANTIIVMKDGTLFHTFSSTQIGSYSYDWDNAWIGRDYRTGDTVLKGTIYAVRMYDKILSDDELQNNYEVDSERFSF
jgi:hypothetical protein